MYWSTKLFNEDQPIDLWSTKSNSCPSLTINNLKGRDKLCEYQSQKRRFKREILAVIVSIFEEPTASMPSTSDTRNTYSSQTTNSTLPNINDSYKDNEFDFLKLLNQD